MRPNTVHFVITAGDSIVYGRHFYSNASMQASVFGIVHTFVMSYRLTNTLHEELDTMLRRMMVMWSAHHFQPVYSKLANPHIPKATMPSGLMDIIALGNLLEFSQVLDRRSYYTSDGIHWQEQHEIAMARHCYRVFQSWFAANHDTAVGGKSISAICIFRRCLVEFAAAIIVYKHAAWAKTPHRGRLRKCTAEAVQEKIMHVFESNFPELLPCLHKLVEDKVEFLYWTGPPISIRSKGAQRRDPMLRDFEDRPIYLGDANNGVGNVAGNGNRKGKGKETASSSLLRDGHKDLDGDPNGEMSVETSEQGDNLKGVGHGLSVTENQQLLLQSGTTGGLLHICTLLTTKFRLSVFTVPGIVVTVEDPDVAMVQDEMEATQSLPQSKNTPAGEHLCVCTVCWYHSLSSDSRSGDPIGPVVEDVNMGVLEHDECSVIDNRQDNDQGHDGMDVENSSPLSSPPSPAGQLPSSESPPRVRRSTRKR
jgi:hypothetical protein